MEVKRRREYPAAKNIDDKMKNDDHREVLIILDRRIISLRRFNDGGAPMFAMDRKNHHTDWIGAIDNNPLVRKILRVLEDS